MNLLLQPTGLVYARSPIIYRFNECSTDYTYIFNLYMSGNTSFSSTPDHTVLRRPDLIQGVGVQVDVSNLLYTELRENIDYDNENIIYFKGELEEYNNNVKTGTTITESCLATLGYVSNDSSYVTPPTPSGITTTTTTTVYVDMLVDGGSSSYVSSTVMSGGDSTGAGTTDIDGGDSTST